MTFTNNGAVWNWTLEEQIASLPETGVETILRLLNELNKFNWKEQDVFGIHMAMEEAVMNAIHHGNGDDAEKKVHIVVKLAEDKFYARIEDQGAGFDPAKVPDPTLEENLEKASGRGVMLMNNFMDRVEYNETGNSVELFKSRTTVVNC